MFFKGRHFLIQEYKSHSIQVRRFDYPNDVRVAMENAKKINANGVFNFV